MPDEVKDYMEQILDRKVPFVSIPHARHHVLLDQPLAFIAHQAGGSTRCHDHDLLHIPPTSLHQRTPLFTGNTAEVNRLVRSMETAVENIPS